MRTTWKLAAAMPAVALTSCSTVAPDPGDGPKKFAEGIDLQIFPEVARTEDPLSFRIASLDGTSVPPHTFTWIVDGAERPDLRTTEVQAAATRKNEVWAIQVDFDDGTIARTDTRILNTSPIIRLTAVDPTPAVDDDLVVQVEVDDADGDDVASSWTWRVDGQLEPSGYADTVPADATAIGERWEISVRGSDGQSYSEAVTTSFIVGNALPEIQRLTLLPSSPTTSDTLRLDVLATDDDGDEVELNIEWLADGQIMPGQRGERSLPPRRTRKGMSIAVEVIPMDPHASGEARVSTPVRIENTPPTLSDALITPSEPTAADILTCTGIGWVDADDDLASWIVEWTIDGEIVGREPTLLAPAFARDDEVRCNLQGSDGEATTTVHGAGPVTVGNAAPRVDRAELSDTTPDEADELTVRYTLSDPDGDDVSAIVKWYVRGEFVHEGASLNGAHFARGDEIFATVTPFDGSTEGMAVATESVSVGNSPPVLLSAVLHPETPGVDDRITAITEVTDVDSDDVTLLYVWYVEGVRIAVSAAADSIGPEDGIGRGDAVHAIITPFDGELYGDPITTDTVVVSNTPPTAPEVAIAPLPAQSKDDLYCELAEEAYDADGDTLTYSIAWDVDGAPFAGATTSVREGDTVPSSATTNGQTWTCKMRAHDGAAAGPAGATSLRITDYGTGPLIPGLSCKDIQTRQNGVSKDGNYWINPRRGAPDSDAFEVYCDMTTDGGGWTRLYKSAFRVRDTEGWNVTATSWCEGWSTRVLGGFAGADQSELQLDLPLRDVAHQHLRVTMNYVAIDSWDDELGYVTIDAEDVYSLRHLAVRDAPSDECGYPDYKDLRAPVDATVAHGNNQVRIVVGATLDEPLNNESFGADDVQVWVR